MSGRPSTVVLETVVTLYLNVQSSNLLVIPELNLKIEFNFILRVRPGLCDVSYANAPKDPVNQQAVYVLFVSPG